MRRSPQARFSRRQFARWVWIVLFIATFVAARWAMTPHQDAAPWVVVREGLHKVVSVENGPVFLIEAEAVDRQGAKQRRLTAVVLLGLAEPERNDSGEDAAQLARSLVGGNPVRLRLDERRFDRRGRLLAYLYVDDLFLNAEIIRAGLAQRQTRVGDSASLARLLKKAEEEAPPLTSLP